MITTRFNAVERAIHRSKDIREKELRYTKISTYFGSHVFGDEQMKEYLTSEAYHTIKDCIQKGTKLSRAVADSVAEAMKQWAMQKGATHYAHWFQPLTGRTAEKHDSFFTLDGKGEAIEEFKGSNLVQQEPDGSSFPGGGLRSTFEARGYTAWDPSSPAFILDSEVGMTMCIPTIFVTFSGESLDYKLPLLKSQTFVENAALQVSKIFDENIGRVFTTLGWEQEFFLVDEALYDARPDLMFTGRTLLGKVSPKGQQLDDHYFGAIPQRIYAYIRELEIECHKLGIPLRTRHNEVGPGQYELAPMYEELNVAVDHNQLLMDLMDRLATKHNLRALLHEKPFEGVNGSGKHNNWSMATDTGKNLLSPGKNPGKNLRFLTFFINTIKAVYDHADLLRASVASASNDERLGANEAPPAIISVFIGDALTNILRHLVGSDKAEPIQPQEVLNLLSKIPDLEKDNTDRNRTSPFAFTGNKFEIRMVGSSMNCASPMTIMNIIVGNQLKKFYGQYQELKNEGIDSDTAIVRTLRNYVIEAEPILFEGDNYSEEWEVEAERRGLPHYRSTPEAIKAYVSEKSKKLFSENNILTEKELDAHYDVMLENYILKMQIESRTLGELCYNHILPAGIAYQTRVAENILKLKEIGVSEEVYDAQTDILQRLAEQISIIKNGVQAMTSIRRKASKTDLVQCADIYCNEIRPMMEKIRVASDRLEYLVEDEEWPLVKYRELLFLR